jgi:hypothetical protein
MVLEYLFVFRDPLCVVGFYGTYILLSKQCSHKNIVLVPVVELCVVRYVSYLCVELFLEDLYKSDFSLKVCWFVWSEIKFIR